MGKTKLSLGDKIARLVSEDINNEDFTEDGLDNETNAKVVEEFDDDEENVQPLRAVRSTLRAKNVKLLQDIDERYAGSKVSRKKLQKTEDSDEEVEDANDSDEDYFDLSGDEEEVEISDEESQTLKDSENEVSEGMDAEISEEEKDLESNDSEGDDISEDESSADEEAEVEKSDEEGGINTINVLDKQNDVEKAQATQQQLRIWDALLEVRIRMQRVLLESNKLPQTNVFQEILAAPFEDSKLPSTLAKSQSAIQDFLENLIELQKSMTVANPELIKHENRKRKSSNPDDEEIPSDDEIISSEDEGTKSAIKKITVEQKSVGTPHKIKKRKIEDYETIILKNIQDFVPFRNDTIQKWNEKTQLSFGKYDKKSTTSHQVPTLKQIEHILSDKQKLIKKTQIRRTSYETIGKTKPKDDLSNEDIQAQPDEEIFDDDDFYHQLLRELIDRKTSNVSDPVQLSRHWLELQKLRTKLKRKVDTKASKGRKIRYDVHTKLVNFMAPHDNSTMTDNAVKELMSSLFGKLR